MTGRTTINIDKETHSKAKETKQKHGETWPEVIEFYTEYRPQVDSGGLDVSTSDIDTDELVSQLEDSMNELSMANDPTTDIDVGSIMAEIKRAQEFAEEAKNNTEQIKEGMGR